MELEYYQNKAKGRENFQMENKSKIKFCYLPSSVVYIIMKIRQYIREKGSLFGNEMI